VFTGVHSLPVSGIIEFSFMKYNEYFVKRWELAQRNIREAGVWGKAATHFIKEGEELTHHSGPHIMDLTTCPIRPYRSWTRAEGRRSVSRGIWML
jgi:hypothetical protein